MPGRLFLCVASTQFADVHGNGFLWGIPVHIRNYYRVDGKFYLSAASDGQSANVVDPGSLGRGKWTITDAGLNDRVIITNSKASSGGATVLSSGDDGSTDVFLEAPPADYLEQQWHITHTGTYSFQLRADANWPDLNENIPDREENEQDEFEENDDSDGQANPSLQSGVEGGRRRRQNVEGQSYLSVPDDKSTVVLGSSDANIDWEIVPAGCQVLDGLWDGTEVHAQWDPVRELIAKETQGVYEGTDLHLAADFQFDWALSVKVSIKSGVKIGILGKAHARASYHQSLEVAGHFEAEENITTKRALKREFRESDIGSWIWQWNIYTTDSCGNTRTTETQQLLLTPGGYQPPCCLPGFDDHDDKLVCHPNQYGEDTLYPGGEQFGCKMYTSSYVV